MTYTQLTFRSGNDDIDAWHFAAHGEAFVRDGRAPVVVMAHGLGGTKDSGLAPFADALAGAGLQVLAFDYRGFGASGGTPRQRVDPDGQVADYHAAIEVARALDGADPDRVVVWGVSLSGGHVFTVAAQASVAAAVSLTPLVDGVAAGVLAARHHPPSALARSTSAGVRSRLRSLTGRAPTRIPLVGRPGEVAALSLDGYFEDYTALAGPTWRNEVDADIGLTLGSFRPGRHASAVSCPMLVQIADFDRSAPPRAAADAAFRARAEVRHYPGDHFDVWPSKDLFAAAVEHQVSFLTRHLVTDPIALTPTTAR